MKRFIREIGTIPKARIFTDNTPGAVFANVLVRTATNETNETAADTWGYRTDPNKSLISFAKERCALVGTIAYIP